MADPLADVDHPVREAATAGGPLDADARGVATTEQDRAVRRAVEPGAQRRAGGRERPAAPGDDLAHAGAVPAGRADARERAPAGGRDVAEVVPAAHVGGVPGGG